MEATSNPPRGALGAVGEGLIELAVGTGAEPAGTLGFGGDAANVCVMAARLGVPARLAGRVGDDALGTRLLDFWEGQGVALDWLARDGEAATGLYVNEPDGSGGHRFTYWRAGSAGSRLLPEDLDAGFFDGLGVLVVTGISLAVSASSAAAVQRAVMLARGAGAQVCCVLNHRPALGGDAGALARLAAAADILIASAEDAQAVFGTSGPAELAGLGPAELVLTNGPEPALVVTHGEAVLQPVPSVTQRNAAGAGDALAGAYLAARLRGRAVADALGWGVAAASLSVQRNGCASSYPDRAQTEAMVRSLPASLPTTLTARSAT